MASEGALEVGKRVIRAEAAGLAALADALADTLGDTLGDDFARAVAWIAESQGRLIVCGVGKSGHVARKISSTFASTGTPSFFLHAAEAGHGDLGIIGAGDVLLVLSNSGQSPELHPVLSFAVRRGLPVVAVTSAAPSPLSDAAEITLLLPQTGEADVSTPAPTTSTTLMLALGDALAVACLHARGFGATDFASLHPSGSLGAQLRRVRDAVEGQDATPWVAPSADLAQTAAAISEGRMGCALVLEGDHLAGIITDGDLRRALLRATPNAKAADLMTRDPLLISPDESTARALALMEERKVTQLIVDQRPLRILHMHTLLRLHVI